VVDQELSAVSGQQSATLDAVAPTDAGSAAFLLRVRNLSYRYPNGQPALHDVKFDIAAGESVGLVGPNGAGKTTLLLHLNGLLPDEAALPSGASVPLAQPVARGQDSISDGVAIHVASRPMSRAHLAEIRRQVGLLFQDPDDQLFCPTVGEDVAFGPLNLGLSVDEVKRRVVESLNAVGLAGYENRGTQRLSFGERRRACLAGVLACQPTLLALDEPSSNLDPRSRRGFIDLVRSLPAAKLIASHDLDMIVELCPRVLVLDHGCIQADGRTTDVLANARLMSEHGLEVPWRLRNSELRMVN
jgi:energy-coupling factor transporter ATP-binding protein EcfA2